MVAPKPRLGGDEYVKVIAKDKVTNDRVLILTVFKCLNTLSFRGLCSLDPTRALMQLLDAHLIVI